MEHRRFGQLEVRREEPLQLSDVSALLAAMRLLCGCTKRKEHVKTSNVGHRQEFFLHSTQKAVVSARNIISKNINLLLV